MALALKFRELTESRPESTYSNQQNSTGILFKSPNKRAVSNILFVITKQELAELLLHNAHNKRWKKITWSNPLLKQGYLEQAAQIHVQIAFEYLQVWRFHKVSG